MASHGKKRHTKRLAAPKVLGIKRKGIIWAKTVRPGPHGKQDSIPLIMLLRDFLKICGSTREARKPLNAGQVLIDGKAIRDIGFPVGLMDIVSLKENSYIVVNVKGKLLPVKTKANYKLCKITGKRLIAKGKWQLSLHDGRSLLVSDAKQYSTGDTLKLSIPQVKVLEHYKLEKGSRCYVFRGRHAGAIGSLVDIQVFPGITPSKARIIGEDGKEVVTLKDYVFVVDKDFKVQ
ncbi:MAG: 30S ribosomal protein S4e [Candidatus Micrarchaeota archaeon]